MDVEMFLWNMRIANPKNKKNRRYVKDQTVIIKLQFNSVNSATNRRVLLLPYIQPESVSLFENHKH